MTAHATFSPREVEASTNPQWALDEIARMLNIRLAMVGVEVRLSVDTATSIWTLTVSAPPNPK